jgi:polar amino acid transport system ATP-binding protein
MTTSDSFVPYSPHNGEVFRVEGIYKSFGKVGVLRGISFVLREKEILGVIGPSGGGKTTLLKCLDFLEKIDSGSIEYLGGLKLCAEGQGVTVVSNSGGGARPFSDDVVSPLRRDIGFVFQGFNLWEERTVLENLILAPTVVLEQNRCVAEGKARELCEQFGLADKITSHAWQLSGGQRQRVAIIRALMMEPKVVLLDEITSALDPVLTVEVMEAILKLRQKGLTMIIVTHHIEFASTLCDRIMFLSEGKNIQLDTPGNLRARPATDEVRRFLEILRTAR